MKIDVGIERRFEREEGRRAGTGGANWPLKRVDFLVVGVDE